MLHFATGLTTRERALAGEITQINIFQDVLTLEYEQEKFSRYSVEWQPDERHLAKVGNPRIFRHPYQSPRASSSGRLVLAAVWGGGSGRRNVQLRAGTIGWWGVRPCATDRQWFSTSAASQQASLPRSPADHTRSCPTARHWGLSPPCRGRWSSRSRTRGRRAADSTPACRTSA